jgi:hypothetical protein
MRETRPLPEDVRPGTPFGDVLKESLRKRKMNKSDLARRMLEINYPNSQPRQAVTNAMNWAEALTYHLVEGIVQALDADEEEESRLIDAARRTKRMYPKGKRHQGW